MIRRGVYAIIKVFPRLKRRDSKEKIMKHISTIAKTERKSAVMGCGECQSSCQSACKTSCTVGNQTCKQEERINNSTKKETL